MQTLANVVAALREDDFSFRARGARRGDALGDLALEINALAGTLQAQRSNALEALTLLERVITSMQSPVLAFDAQSRLRLHNAAADRIFSLKRPDSDGRTAGELQLRDLLLVTDEGTYSGPPKAAGAASAAASARYLVRRAAFRLRGMPHTLLVLSDVGAALREEERQAWQRLIRVLGHEINNSLTPIKSIAGSLRTRLPEANGTDSATDSTRDMVRDIARGLAVIEDRAASLNRFLQAYQQLSALPAPRLQTVPLVPLLERVAQLEQRLQVELAAGPEATLLADPDQLQQALINLVQNAADAALEATQTVAGAPIQPCVRISWAIEAADTAPPPRATPGRFEHDAPAVQPAHPQAIVRIVDNGLGLLNPVNLFVPFYTTKPAGTGIGLALAQQILIAHRGGVSLANRADAPGCVAEVRIPL